MEDKILKTVLTNANGTMYGLKRYLPGGYKQGTKSKDLTALRMATMLNIEKDTVLRNLNDKNSQTDGFTLYAKDNLLGQLFLKIFKSFKNNLKFVYKNDKFKQNEYKKGFCERDIKTEIDEKSYKTTEYADGTSLTVCNELNKTNARALPFPVLIKNKDGKLETSYAAIDSRKRTIYTLEGGNAGIIVNNKLAQNISEDTMSTYVNKIRQDRSSTPKQKAFAKYYESYDSIPNFQKNKEQVFDKQIAYATEAYNKLKDKPNDKIIINSSSGEALVVNKQKDSFDIEVYDENDVKKMKGKFTLLKDKNGFPLKEDKNGKILQQNNPRYNNPSNKLCFTIKECFTYNDLGVKEFESSRHVNVENEKYIHNIKFAKFDRNGEIIENGNLLLPKYSQDWFKTTLPKVYHDIYKSDLKAAKKEMEYLKMAPQDVEI